MGQWYKNPCRGQWLVIDTWHGEASERSWTTWNIGAGESGRLGGATGGALLDAPICDVGGRIATSDPLLLSAPDHPGPT